MLTASILKPRQALRGKATGSPENAPHWFGNNELVCTSSGGAPPCSSVGTFMAMIDIR